MKVRLGTRLCGTGDLKALPPGNSLPFRLLRQREKHLHTSRSLPVLAHPVKMSHTGSLGRQAPELLGRRKRTLWLKLGGAQISKLNTIKVKSCIIIQLQAQKQLELSVRFSLQFLIKS